MSHLTPPRFAFPRQGNSGSYNSGQGNSGFGNQVRGLVEAVEAVLGGGGVGGARGETRAVVLLQRHSSTKLCFCKRGEDLPQETEIEGSPHSRSPRIWPSPLPCTLRALPTVRRARATQAASTPAPATLAPRTRCAGG